MASKFEIHVQGILGPVLRAAFPDLSCAAVSRHSTIRGRLSEDELRELLICLDQLGIELVGVRCRHGAGLSGRPYSGAH